MSEDELERVEMMARARRLVREALATREQALARGPFWPDYASALMEVDRDLSDARGIYARLDATAPD